MADFLPRRWRRQPTYPVRVDLGNKLLQYGQNLYLGALPVNLLTGLPTGVTRNNPAAPQYFSAGVSRPTTQGTTTEYWTEPVSSAQVNARHPWTIAAVVTPIVTLTDGGLAMIYDSGAGAWDRSLQGVATGGNAGFSGYLFDGSARTVFDGVNEASGGVGAFVPTVGRPYCIVLTGGDGGLNFKLWRDALNVGTTVVNNLGFNGYGAAAVFQYGLGNQVSHTQPCQMLCSQLLRIDGQAWNISQIQSFTENAYQWYQPYNSVSYFIPPPSAPNDVICTVYSDEDDPVEELEESFTSIVYDSAPAAATFDAIETVYAEDEDEVPDDEPWYPQLFDPAPDCIQDAFGEELDEEEDTDNWIGYTQDYVDASFLPPVDSGELDEEDDTDNFTSIVYDVAPATFDVSFLPNGLGEETDEEDDTDNGTSIVYDAAPVATSIEWVPNADSGEGEEEEDTEAFTAIVYDAAPPPQVPTGNNYHSWFAKSGIKTKISVASQVDGETGDTS